MTEDEENERERSDLISRAISIAHAEITSGRKVKIRDQKDDMEEYAIAKASLVPDFLLSRRQGWARRDCLEDEEGMYGADYMTDEYKAVVVELFERGVAHSCNKMSPSLMREELEIRFPGYYTYPPESEITKCISSLYDAQKKAKTDKAPKTIKVKKIPKKVEKMLREVMAADPLEKGAAIANRVLAAYKRRKIPDCTRKDVLDRVNSLRQQEKNKLKKIEMRKLIG